MIRLHDYVAVLIDAENIPLKYTQQVLKFAEYYGQLEVCSAYGDWNSPSLRPSCEKIDALNVERIQVEHTGKDAADHRLLIELGKILGNEFHAHTVETFIVVSGDVGFANACHYLKSEGRQVIVMAGRKQPAPALRKSFPFHNLEDLNDELANLEKRYPISPEDVRFFFYRCLIVAYHHLTGQKWDWVTYSQLDAMLREQDVKRKTVYAKYELSEWLRHLAPDFETDGQRTRRVDLNPADTRRNLLIGAYIRTKNEEGLASLPAFGKMLREIDEDYQNRFSSKKLSEWLKAYPDDFEIRDNHVFHRTHWQ